MDSTHRLDNESREEPDRMGQGTRNTKHETRNTKHGTRNTQEDQRVSIQIKFKGRVDGGTSSE